MDERVDERERAAEERRSRRERLLDRVERITEAPLLILAAVMIPLIVGPFVWELSERQEEVFVALDIFIWAAFVADIVVKTAIAPRKLAYLKAHWIDLAILVAPPIRPLRLVRLLVYGSRLFMGLRRMVQVDYLLVYAVLLVMVSATVVTTVETARTRRSRRSPTRCGGLPSRSRRSAMAISSRCPKRGGPWGTCLFLAVWGCSARSRRTSRRPW